jgi:hypothetical protein
VSNFGCRRYGDDAGVTSVAARETRSDIMSWLCPGEEGTIHRMTGLDHCELAAGIHSSANACKEIEMRNLVVATILFVLIGLSPSYARGGVHGSDMNGLTAPANPTVPPSLTPDPRLAGTAPVPPHHQPTAADVSSLPDPMVKLDPEDAAVDRAIGNICRGC